MKIMAFGKKMTGELLFNPLEEQQFLGSLKAALPHNVSTLRQGRLQTEHTGVHHPGRSRAARKGYGRPA